MKNNRSIPEQRRKLRQLSDFLDEITRLYLSPESHKNNDTYFLEQIDMLRLELLSLKNESRDQNG